MIRDDARPPPLPARLPLWELEGRTIFPTALSTIPLPLSVGKDYLKKVRAGSGYMAVLPVAPGNHRAKSCIGLVVLLLRMAPSGSPGKGLFLVQGVARAHLTPERKRGPLRWAAVTVLPDKVEPSAMLTSSALRGNVLQRLDALAGTPHGIPAEMRDFLGTVTDPGRFSDLVADQLDLSFEKAMELLKERNPVSRLDSLWEALGVKQKILAIQEKLDRKTRDEMDKRQREYFLRQQMEAIQRELSNVPGNDRVGETTYRKRLESLPLVPEVLNPITKEIEKLALFNPFSEELSQVKAYLDLVLDLPWAVFTKDNLDLKRARRDLDRDHYGLKKVKERILEYLAVRKLKGKNPSTLFCLVGAPGVGKTSLGKAIARTLGRKFVRMSLGGVHDEAEIRGHRRTYIGAMPGRIIQGIRNAGAMNPVFVLDEVDKMGSDWRGDPSSALLEALDPEQNREFVDNYLGFPFDLSRVIFIATANTLEGIRPAFLDRLEILELSGYTAEEKLAIAKRHLIKRLVTANGLEKVCIDIPDNTILALVRRYTREAGVRELERSIEAILRKLAIKAATGSVGPYVIEEKSLAGYLGLPHYFEEERLVRDTVGVATGLAWTEAGGELLFVEATLTEGSGALTLTGQMGDVMRESAQAAMTYIKEHLPLWSLAPKFLAKKDLHIHVPEGAIPKDGPSAGVTMAVALLSTLTGAAPPRFMAFSGEITLRGKVLPVGGLKEKLLAARRAGIKTVLLPYGNRNELRELPASIKKSLELAWVRDMGEVFKRAFPAMKSHSLVGSGHKGKKAFPKKVRK